MAATSPEVLVDQQPGLNTGGRQHISALTGLRGFAALVVVVGHCAGISALPWIGLPSYGPIALFVLSGYLLFQPWSKWFLGFSPRPSLKIFAWRRIWRICPPYIALLSIVWLVLPASRPTTGEMWIRVVTLTNIYVPGGLSHGLGHTWSLGTELSWYAVLPIVAIVIGFLVRRGLSASAAVGLIVVGMLALTLVWRTYGHSTDHYALSMTYPMLFPAQAICFFGGAALGHLKVMQSAGMPLPLLEKFSRRGPMVLVLAAGAGALGASQYGGPWGLVPSSLSETLIRSGSMTALALLLLAGVAFGQAGGFLMRVFGSRPAVAVGRWSYGIYLWHFPIVVLLVQHFSGPGNLAELLVWILGVASVATALGAVTYAFIERPAIAFSKRSKMSTA